MYIGCLLRFDLVNCIFSNITQFSMLQNYHNSNFEKHQAYLGFVELLIFQVFTISYDPSYFFPLFLFIFCSKLVSYFFFGPNLPLSWLANQAWYKYFLTYILKMTVSGGAEFELIF